MFENVVGLLNTISERIRENVGGIQIGTEREKTAVGDIEGLVIPYIKRVDGGTFGRAGAGATYFIVLELYTRRKDLLHWFKVADQIIYVLNGMPSIDGFSVFNFAGLSFLGMRDEFFVGEINFDVKNYSGAL